jgi:Nif-specific regulatory protein
MNPRLAVIAGPLQGATYALTATEICIGRDPANNICLSDPLVSRRHCVITRAEAGFEARDQQSANGTTINERPMDKTVLVEGDRLQIGDSVFLFLTEEAPPPPPRALRFEERPVVTRATITLAQHEILYWQPEKLSTLPLSPKMAQQVGVLLKSSHLFSQLRQLADLPPLLLQLLDEIYPMEFSAVLLEQERFPFNEQLSWTRQAPGLKTPPPLIRTLVQRAVREQQASLNLLTDPVEPEAPAEPAAVLVVPLQAQDSVLGVLYQVLPAGVTSLADEQLGVLTALTSQAALVLANLRQLDWLTQETRRLQEELYPKPGLIGVSEPMQKVLLQLRRMAETGSTILIRGESGTGKEIVAREIHQHSPRRAHAFIPVNCAALPDELLASQLFGHRRGAFTGATADQAGVFEAADGGTLFLDEIGDISAKTQVSLLRAIQERTITRLGEQTPRKVDVRILVATHRNLEDLVKQGVFREDLYYRLNVITLRLPPLRERPADIPALARYFVKRYSRTCKRPVKGLAPETYALLCGYHWPGNVRELENALERAVALGRTELIQPEDLPETILDVAVPVEQTGYHAAVKTAKRQILLRSLEKHAYNYTAAAAELELHDSNLHRMARDLGLKPAAPE